MGRRNGRRYKHYDVNIIFLVVIINSNGLGPDYFGHIVRNRRQSVK